MRKRHDDADPWDDDRDDRDYRDDPLDADQDTHDDPETAACPFCGAAVSEVADVCPRCGNFIVSEDAPRPGKPWWVVAAVIAVLAAMLIGGLRLAAW